MSKKKVKEESQEPVVKTRYDRFQVAIKIPSNWGRKECEDASLERHRREDGRVVSESLIREMIKEKIEELKDSLQSATDKEVDLELTWG